MKYMLLITSDAASEAGVPPSRELIAAMGGYNDELIKAGVFLGAEGLRASSSGARVAFHGDEHEIIDGPFTETKELIAGFWIIQASSKEEAVAWAERVPIGSGTIEVRRVVDPSDFDRDDEHVQREVAWRTENEPGFAS
ncbi:MAG: hypothetical protein JWN09_1205 [Microbacteriaceae bacterium]|nr:hypothetical protein [Microbacteriaceae bacterium]